MRHSLGEDIVRTYLQDVCMFRMLTKDEYEGTGEPPKKLEVAQNGGSRPPTAKPGELPLATFLHILQASCSPQQAPRPCSQQAPRSPQDPPHPHKRKRAESCWPPVNPLIV